MILGLVIHHPTIHRINFHSIHTDHLVQVERILILIELIVVLVRIIIHVLQVIDTVHRLHLNHIQDDDHDDRGVVVDLLHRRLIHLHRQDHVHPNLQHPVQHQDLILQVHRHLDRVHHVVQLQIINDRMISE